VELSGAVQARVDMSAAGSYGCRDVITPPSAPQPSDRQEEAAPDADEALPGGVQPAVADEPDAVDLSGLSVAGITRRRVGWLVAAIVSAWIVVVFARQAGDTAAASNRADQIARDNAALAAEVAALKSELKIIERPEYVAQQARAYRVGSRQEIPFTLDPSVPDPGPDAPGSASLRVGAPEERPTPLESWLSLLFGPTD
jgi:cell division protein FtsB